MITVVDTNVILVANGQHADVNPTCVETCALRLQAIMADQRIAIDADYEILQEYQKKTKPRKGNGPGDAFVKWALQNNANSKRCDVISIQLENKKGYKSFPDDPRLADFDPADQKFVAVAAAHSEHPPILQAADSKWLDWTPALNDHNIEVEFLCPEDIQRFRDNKAAK
jgi:hypothetical protein